MKCDIIIPVWNQLEYTRNCIENIFCTTSYPYRLILIDNGSDEETGAYLGSVKNRQDKTAAIMAIYLSLASFGLINSLKLIFFTQVRVLHHIASNKCQLLIISEEGW